MAESAVRHNKSPINDLLPGLDESLLRDLDTLKLIPPNDPKLLAVKRLLNDADAAIQHAEEIRAKTHDLRRKFIEREDGGEHVPPEASRRDSD